MADTTKKLPVLVGFASASIGLLGGLFAAGASQGARDQRITVVEANVADQKDTKARVAVVEARIGDMVKKLDTIEGDVKALLRHAGAK